MKIRFLLVGAMLGAAALWAQDPGYPGNPGDQNAAPDPPSRVARLNHILGQVSFQPAGVQDWTAATLNYPVTTGDHLYADANSAAELHIGSTVIRLSSLAGAGIVNLDDRVAQLRLDQGSLILRVRFIDGSESYEVDTAQGAVTILRPGEYRIDTDPARNATMVTVRSGDAEVSANGEAFPVHARSTAFFGQDGQPQVQSENPIDSFDQFSMDRDRDEDRMPPPRYVSRDMPGWQDLDRNGSWSDTREYGPVWRPRVASDWAPYRYGHWAWIEPWGWTWIDDAPWGFAPFHYGRWVNVGGGWAWVPGSMSGRPVYAPALVAFVGGASFRVGGGGVGVAWFPLGPREAFVPAYHHSDVYVTRVNVTTVNVTNVTVVNRTYINQTVGVTAVNQNAFTSARPVHQSMVVVPRDAMMRAQVVGTAPTVAPQRMSVLGGGGGNVPHPSAAVMNRQVYTRQAPPPPPVSFAARQQALQANPGHPVDPQTMNRLRGTEPVRQPAYRTAGPSGNQGGQGFGGSNQRGNQQGGTQFGNQQGGNRGNYPGGNQSTGAQPGGTQGGNPPNGNRGNYPGGNQSTGAQSGGTPGGNPPGGNRGNYPGGNQSTGAQPGGTPGGSQPGANRGNYPGGNQSTGAQPGGTPGGNQQGGSRGNYPGGNQSTGAQPGGTPGGNPQGGNRGNYPGGNQSTGTQPGGTPGGNQQGGNRGNYPGGNQPATGSSGGGNRGNSQTVAPPAGQQTQEPRTNPNRGNPQAQPPANTPPHNVNPQHPQAQSTEKATGHEDAKKKDNKKEEKK